MATRRRIRPFTFLLSAFVALVCLPWTLVTTVARVWWNATRWTWRTATCQRIRTQTKTHERDRPSNACVAENTRGSRDKTRRSTRKPRETASETAPNPGEESDASKEDVQQPHQAPATKREGQPNAEQVRPGWEESNQQTRFESHLKSSPVVRTAMAPPYSRTAADCNPKKKTLVRTWCIASVALCLVALSTMAVTQHLQVERKLLLALGLPVAWFLIGSIGKGSERDGGRENHTGTLLMAGTFSWFVVGFVACVLIREGLLVQDESLHCEGAGDLSMLTS